MAWADYSGDGLLDVFGAFELPWDNGSSALCTDGPDGWGCEDFVEVTIAARGINSDAVPFDADLTQRMSDRGVRILQATDAGELLPRVAANRDFFECRFCSWAERCWGLPG